MKFRLIEEYLYEDINSMLKYYPTIPESDLRKYIALDPTYKQGSNKAGKYAKWILGLVQRGKMDNEGHIKDILTRFESEKKNLKNTDIMQYKTIDELEDALRDTNNQDTELSHRQEVRNRQKDRKNADLSKDAKIVAKADGYTVWVPHTYAASCKLGQGARWCTASTEDDYYYNYYKQEYGGEYYIIINDSNPSEKYQFHKQSDQYMDKDDEEIDLYYFLIDKPNLLNELTKLDAIPYNIKEDIDKINKLKDNGGNYIYSGEDIIPDILKKYIKTVTIKDGVKDIPYHAFSGCTSITIITIPNSVKRIGPYAFCWCDGLTSITIPSSVTSIGLSAFYECRSLTNITIPSSVTSISNGAFDGCSSLTSISIPNSVTRIGEKAFYKCTNLKSITIPNSVTHIGGYTFSHCESLKSITIPNSVTEIGLDAFYGCKNLENIRIPKKLKDKINQGFIDVYYSIGVDSSIVEWY